MIFRTYDSGTTLRTDTATVPGGSCTIANGRATCPLGDVAPGGTRTIMVRATAVGVGYSLR